MPTEPQKLARDEAIALLHQSGFPVVDDCHAVIVIDLKATNLYGQPVTATRYDSPQIAVGKLKDRLG